MARSDPSGQGSSLMGEQTFEELIQSQTDEELERARLASELIPAPLGDALDGMRKLHMLVNGARVKSMSSSQRNNSKGKCNNYCYISRLY